MGLSIDHHLLQKDIFPTFPKDFTAIHEEASLRRGEDQESKDRVDQGFGEFKS